MYTPAVPLTGVAGLRFLDSTMEQQRAALSASAENAREIDYFKENIGKIGSADELLADRRLLTVAMTAYGLESEIDKTYFVKQVLESNPNDSASFANVLNDRRWSSFARDFGFGDATAGREETALQISVNLRVQGATSEFQPDDRDLIDAEKLDHFRTHAATLTSTDELMADPILLEVALAAFELDRTYYSDATIVDFIENGVDVSAGGEAFQETYGAELQRWADFSAAMQGLSSGGAAYDVSRFGFLVDQQIARAGVQGYTQEEADADPGKISADDLDAFRLAAESIDSVEDLLADPTALKVVKVAYGLADEDLTNQQIQTLLEGGPESALALEQDNFGWRQLASAFEESVVGGAIVTMTDLEVAVELAVAENGLEALPSDAQPPQPPEIDADELAYFNETIGSIESVEDLVADKRLLAVALTTFGLEDENRSDEYIIDILSEDPYDDASFVNQLSDTRWRDLSRAFSPSADSSLGRDVIQFELETRLTALDAPQEDIDYLRKNMNLVEEPSDLIFDSKLKDIALSAFGLEKGAYSNTFFVNALISDPTDPNSFVNQLGDPRWIEFAETFGSGGGSGNVALESFQADVLAKFEERSFEAAVGAVDEDLRLALNFRRAIEDIAGAASVEENGWLRLLGDEPLVRVVRTAFNLPTEFSQLSLDAQVEDLGTRASALFGGADPSVFLDAENVETAVSRFLSISSLETSSTSSAVTLMSQSVTLARSSVSARF